MVTVPAISILWLMLATGFFFTLWRPKWAEENEGPVFVGGMFIFCMVFAMITLGVPHK